MERPTNKGFSLIEILVVIAIIGVLSAIILASLAASRNKAIDAAIKHQLSDMRPAAELIYTNTGSYDTVCSPNTNSGQMYFSAFNISDKMFSSAQCVPSGTQYYAPDSYGNIVTIPKPTTPSKWRASVKLKGDGYFCVDYTGAAATVSFPPVDPNNVDC
jgi:prepilin-type N-terminal cleavage/methylation domain-containing protein